MGGGGFEPPKASPTDLQSAPFDRSGIPPSFFSPHIYVWSRWTDSNRRPADYKSAALPTELHRPENMIYKELYCFFNIKKQPFFLKKDCKSTIVF